MIEALNRIIIGDVGSGKTIVAFLIALTYLFGLKDTGQVAMMAPTEVLAFQHYKKLLELTNLPQNDWVNTVYLSGKNILLNNEKITKGKLQKWLINEQTKQVAEGGILKIFWVGTHAIYWSDMLNLDLAMVDEQHRFGVRDRKKMTDNDQVTVPHFLSFTATPIPRTLALTMYRNLKPHFLKTLASRKVIQTSISNFNELESYTLSQIRSQISDGKKVYIVCAKVEETDKDELWSTTKAKKWVEKHFPDQALVVHGKLADKKDILQEFKDSKTKNILVATTVIEVGVDVGMATLVIIFNAERFGLSALHQIRGRVGRNDFDNNYCILVSDFRYSRRLKYLCEFSDGFTLAEKDLELRGSGDMIGVSQSGFGDDIESIMGLHPKLYEQMSSLVDTLDIQNLEKLKKELPRLANYLNIQASKIWEE